MAAKEKGNEVIKIIGYIILIEVIGSAGALATNPQIPTWYASINKPFFNPPNWIFGPVWTLLFALLGYNLYLLNKSKKKEAKEAIETFWKQMVLNVLWSFLFFGNLVLYAHLYARPRVGFLARS